MDIKDIDNTTVLHVEMGAGLIDFEPGNCTKYRFLVRRLGGDLGKKLGCGTLDSKIFTLVNFPKSPSIILVDDSVLVPSYVREKLGVNEADAEVLSPFLEKLSRSTLTWYV